MLAELLGTDLVIDNDVNWAAFAEHRTGAAGDLSDFCYCHLGHGLGGAVVRAGEPVRGSAGLAGEIAHLLTVGPGGRSMRLVDCFGVLELLHAGSAAIDVDRVRDSLSTEVRRPRVGAATPSSTPSPVRSARSPRCSTRPASSSAGRGARPADFVDRLAQRVDEVSVVATQLRTAQLGAEAPLSGARLATVRDAQNSLVGPLAREIGG